MNEVGTMTGQPVGIETETETMVELAAEKGEETMIAIAESMTDTVIEAVTGRKMSLVGMIQGAGIGHVLDLGTVLEIMIVTGSFANILLVMFVC